MLARLVDDVSRPVPLSRHPCPRFMFASRSTRDPPVVASGSLQRYRVWTAKGSADGRHTARRRTACRCVDQDRVQRHQRLRMRLTTRERVERAIAELGYTPNLTARSLRSGRTAVERPSRRRRRGAGRSALHVALPPPVVYNVRNRCIHRQLARARRCQDRGTGLFDVASRPGRPTASVGVEAHTPAPTGGGVR
jgi:hypothetical protein